MRITKTTNVSSKWNIVRSKFLEEINFFEKKKMLLRAVILFCSISFFLVLKNNSTGEFDLTPDDRYKNNYRSPRVIQAKEVVNDARNNSSYMNKKVNFRTPSDDS